MNNIKYMGLVAVFSIISVLVLLAGCGTTSRSFQGETQIGEAADIDELLGLADEKLDKNGADDSIAEDDVLKLLGVGEENQPKVSDTVSDANNKQNLNNTETGKGVALQNEEDAGAGADLENENADKNKPINKTLPEWRATSFNDRYTEARQDYRNRHYREAIQKFEALLSISSNHSLSDNCQYWIGESYYGMENYRQAAIAFEKVFSIPKSNKDDAAQLKLGLCYIRLSDMERARVEFQKLIDNYPTSEHISMAKKFIESLDNQ